MKKLIIIPLLFINLILSATNYYVKNAGDDTKTGLSDALAWKTIDKVRASIFVAGDSILFKRGNTWVIEAAKPLSIAYNGSVGNPIVFGAYGTGLKPILTGFSTIAGWTDEGGDIYSKVVSYESNADIETFVVTVDGVNTPMGRYPETGWLTYEHHIWISTVIGKFVDHETLSGTTDWTGAEAVMRKWVSGWMVDRNPITNHSNDTIYYTNGSTWEGYDGYGWYVQRDLRTLTYDNAWYYDLAATKLYLYSTVDPSGKVVKFSTVKHGMELSANSYITVDNISFIGFNNYGTYNMGSDHIIIQNCKFQFIGYTAMMLSPYHGGASVLTYQNDSILNCSEGIEIRGTGTNFTITNNVFTDIGLIQGGCALLTGDTWGDAISSSHNYTTISYNRITNVGHIGIKFTGAEYGGVRYGDHTIVNNNYINGFGLTRYDAGGIYTQNPHGFEGLNWQINNNIVRSSKQTSDGMAGGTYLYLWGIYLDQHSTDVEILGNSVDSVSTGGIFLFATENDTVTGNTVYNCGRGLDILDRADWVDMRVTGLDMDDNIFFAKDSTQLALYYNTSDVYTNYGTSNLNYYARPVDDDLTIQTAVGGGAATARTIAGWKTLSGQDANSNKSLGGTVNNTDKVHYIVNDTTINKTFILSANMKDVANADYLTGSIYLSPYTSLALIGAGTVVEKIAGTVFPTVVTVGLINRNAKEATVSAIITSAGGGTLTYRGLCWSTSINPTTANSKTQYSASLGTFTDVMRGLSGGTTYYVKSYCINEEGTAYGEQISFTTPPNSIITSGGKVVKSINNKIIEEK